MKKISAIFLAAAMALSMSVPAFAATAVPTASRLLVNDEDVSLQAYNVEGNNYFKLRDLSVLMDGTICDFRVGYDDRAKAVVMTTGVFPGEGVLSPVVKTGVKNAVVSDQAVILDQVKTDLKAYNVDGYNYFKLRDLGDALGFSVAWDEGAKTISVTAKKLVIEEPEKPIEKPVEKEPAKNDPIPSDKDEEDEEIPVKKEEEKAIVEIPLEEMMPEKETIVDTEEEFEARVLELVNEAREAEGLSPLRIDDDVAEAADVRAAEVAKSFSHTRPDGRRCFTALEEAGVSYRSAGENIAKGQRTPESVMDAWMNSSGHRANILNDSFQKIGIGYGAGNSWVQMFIG